MHVEKCLVYNNTKTVKIICECIILIKRRNAFFVSVRINMHVVAFNQTRLTSRKS